ncbi:MAG: Nif11-like leader peptide family natural product precursor [Ruminococcus sp.]|nr:Nif11-like leader peptide family natural product precursor [Ruminococcus sp.]
MSMENAKKFLKDVQNDKSLQTKLDNGTKTATIEEKLEALTTAAKSLKYDFTVAELREASIDDAQVSNDEFENVIGGNCVAFASGKCICFGDGGHCTCFGNGCTAVFT